MSHDDRFEFRRRLGDGGYGEVFEMFDLRRGVPVAVKRLRKSDATALLRFKQEFRAVADVRHRNLVRLDEMFHHDGDWYVAMELVDGVPLLEWVRPPERRAHGFRTDFDESRLRDAFAQLADGLVHLHAAGMLHRDLKPSNVLVARDGRVVVLDFGLVTHLGDPDVLSGSNLVGTPAYMSPEHVRGDTMDAASDWYSVGLMLYEALTGELPFSGNYLQLLHQRVQEEAPSVRSVDAAIPRDLDLLCRDLLDREPTARPAGAEIARRLRRVERAPRTPTADERAAPAFVGRATELQALRAAFDRARGGTPVVARLAGLSGMGKTTLARQFLASLPDDALIFQGRCYQREAVPYKALDTLVDGISKWLRGRSADEVRRFVPPDIGALARMFPVLREFEPHIPGDAGRGMSPDALEVRRRGSAALRLLLQRLGAEHTPVLFVDDLQWGDADSGQLLLELLRVPEPPRLLFVACYREDEAAQSPLLQLLDRDQDTPVETHRVRVGDLSTEEARALALARLGGDAAQAALAESLAAEARGNPFLVDQLAHFRRLAGGASSRTLRLESVVDFTLAQLPVDARRLLEVVAVVARPLALPLANQAAGLDPRAVEPVEALRGGRWIRTRDQDGVELLEPYHDRLRETIVALLSREDLPAINQRVALALEAGGTADAEALSEHFAQAGDVVLAARHAARAAVAAAELLAFERAATLYRRALEPGIFSDTESRAMRIRLAEALANVGHGEAAAREFLRAAEGAAADEALECRRRAAESLLMSGRIEEGVEWSAQVLKAIGLSFSRSPRRALLRLLGRRAMLTLRGLRFTPRAASELDPARLRRMDISWSVGAGLSMVDPIQANLFQVTNLLQALSAGEPFRIARALGMELAVSSMGGTRTAKRTRDLQARTQQLTKQVAQPYTDAWFALIEALSANLGGRYAEAVEHATRSEQIFRERCTGVAWETETAQLYHLHSLANLGRWRELAAHALPLLAGARERGDLYLATYVQARNQYLFHLLDDDPAGAHAAQASALVGWTGDSFQLQHYWQWYGEGEIALYEGRAAAAWAAMQAGWRRYNASMLRRTQAIHIEILFQRLRIAVALAVTDAAQRDARLADADADLSRIERERSVWGNAQAALGRALVARARGVRDPAAFERAAAALETMHLDHYAAAARQSAAALSAAGNIPWHDWFTREQVRAPARLLLMLAP